MTEAPLTCQLRHALLAPEHVDPADAYCRIGGCLLWGAPEDETDRVVVDSQLTFGGDRHDKRTACHYWPEGFSEEEQARIICSGVKAQLVDKTAKKE